MVAKNRSPYGYEYHGYAPANRPLHPLYGVWSDMKRRCYNSKRSDYARYGGKGIKVCERWRRSFAAFLADMGERPPGHSLERIDSTGDYEPGNVRWATATEQARNRRIVKLSIEMAQDIRQLKREGWTYSQLTAKFGIGKAALSQVVAGHNWKE